MALMLVFVSKKELKHDNSIVLIHHATIIKVADFILKPHDFGGKGKGVNTKLPMPPQS